MEKFSAAQFESVGARYALPVLAINTMPALICGLLFAGIISATMSSSDSDLLGAGSIFANDIYKAVLKPDASSKSVMNVTKIVMFLVGVASMFIALINAQSIVSILMFCFTLCAAGSFFPYVMGHYWKKASKAGMIASLLAACFLASRSASRSVIVNSLKKRQGLFIMYNCTGKYWVISERVYPRASHYGHSAVLQGITAVDIMESVINRNFQVEERFYGK